MKMIFKRCELCRKIWLSKNFIYVKMYGNDRSGNYCFDCLKGYLRSSLMEIKDYVNSPRFRSDPKFMEKLEEVNKILHI